MLENDLFVERFFSHHATTLTWKQAEGLMSLMDLSDNDLLDLLLARKEPDPAVMPDAAVQVLHMMRMPR